MRLDVYDFERIHALENCLFSSCCLLCCLPVWALPHPNPASFLMPHFNGDLLCSCSSLFALALQDELYPAEIADMANDLRCNEVSCLIAWFCVCVVACTCAAVAHMTVAALLGSLVSSSLWQATQAKWLCCLRRSRGF